MSVLVSDGSSSSGEQVSSVRNKLNLNEEYMEAFRTKSYKEIWSKVQEGQLRRTSATEEQTLSSLFLLSPFPSYICNHLLEPPQEFLIEMIESCSGSDHQLRSLLMDYFECSYEACKICWFLLQNIDQTRIDYSQIQKIINLNCSGDYTDDQCRVIFHELASFAKLTNPLSSLSLFEFQLIHDRYEFMLKQLTVTYEKIKKRAKLIRLWKKAAGISLVITCSALAVATLILAAHTLVGIAASPAVVTVSLGLLKRKIKSIRMALNTSLLYRVGAQIDAAARGVYILNRDFDTVNRLVMRLHNEIDHGKDIAKMGVRNQNRQMLMEVMREFKTNESGFLEHLRELEEHVYLCLLTINRARRLVLQEIMVHPQGNG
ncbi:UPF0496 protein At1g20180-like [Telopea speciosissima]|uniref:UPF0496 protein At1g20180-like n=1 Tax=Telopea speciosissima TaxID=54955 RepID=UPI001CC54655|nr:UPF0496 protein At1g20180-like [Telopea speciosissima]